MSVSEEDLLRQAELIHQAELAAQAERAQPARLDQQARLGQQAELARKHGKHMLSELQFRPVYDGLDRGEVFGETEVTPYMHAPGAPHLRTSILAMWSDMLGGILSLAAMRPRGTVTLELDVHLYRPAPTGGIVRAEGRTVKAGRSVHVAHVEYLDGNGDPFGFSTSSFMAAPDATFTAPSLTTSMRIPRNPDSLTVPLAERAGLIRRAPGVAELPLSDDGLNSTDTMHGGLIALVAEESVLSLGEPGAMVCSLQVRYLSPVRTGPAIASATGHGRLFRAELRDEGHAGRLAALATARTF